MRLRRWALNAFPLFLPAVPFTEMLSAEVLPPLAGMWRLPGTRLHRLVVWTFRRMAHSPAAWQPRQVGGPEGSRL